MPAGVRQEVRRRARNCCEYCQSQERFSPSVFSVEHIEPQHAGGADRLENYALACQECNNHKYTAVSAPDPLTGEIVRLFHPRRDRWGDHFAWNEDYTLLLGLTPIGRATVAKLCLNRSSVVNIRRVLRLTGNHPLTGAAEDLG